MAWLITALAGPESLVMCGLAHGPMSHSCLWSHYIVTTLLSPILAFLGMKTLCWCAVDSNLVCNTSSSQWESEMRPLASHHCLTLQKGQRGKPPPYLGTRLQLNGS